MVPIPTPAEAAMFELRRRRDLATEAIRNGAWTAEQANQRLAPWAAIAIRAGADVPPLRLCLADQVDRAAQAWRDFSTARLDSVARALLADSLAPRDQWAPMLTEARDKALNRFTGTTPPTDAETDQARALNILCVFFRLPAWRAPTLIDQLAERKAA